MRCAVSLALSMLAFTSFGCAYRLKVPIIAPPLRIRIIDPSPGTYRLRLNIGRQREYSVPRDGRLSLERFSYRPNCKVSLLGIRVNQSDPLQQKIIDFMTNGKTIRRTSWQHIAALPQDSEGYHLLCVMKRSSCKVGGVQCQ